MHPIKIFPDTHTAVSYVYHSPYEIVYSNSDHHFWCAVFLKTRSPDMEFYCKLLKSPDECSCDPSDINFCIAFINFSKIVDMFLDEEEEKIDPGLYAILEEEPVDA